MSVTLSHIAHRFGENEILRDVSLAVETGDIACLLGPSGCGKTTLLRLIAGLEPLQRGEILIGAAGDKAPSLKKGGVAIVFQDFLLFPHMTALENVAFGLEGSAREARARALAELEAVDLGDTAGRYPHQLSGGQQQRVALARAFARDPALILLDEPFASIDAALRRRLRHALRAMLKARGATAILVTHDPEEALDLGDMIAIMGAGAIIEAGSPQRLYEAPQTVEAASIFPGAQMSRASRLAALGASTVALGETNEDDLIVLLAGALKAAPDVEAASASVVDRVVARAIDCRFAGPDYMIYVAEASQISGDGLSALRAESAVSINPGAPVRLSLDPSRVRRFAKNAQTD